MIKNFLNYEKFLVVFLFVLFFVVFLPSPKPSLAHPGRTDASGCHTCKTNCPNWGLSYGEYHCHNSTGLPQPEYPIRSHYGEGGTGTTEPWPDYVNQYDSYSTPSCPLFSTHDSISGSCKCISGYIVDGNSCVDGDIVCHRKYGYNSSYSSLDSSCECDYDYKFDSKGQCVSQDNYCKDLHGYGAEYNILSKSCVCQKGYKVNSVTNSCVYAGSSSSNNYTPSESAQTSQDMESLMDQSCKTQLGNNSFYVPSTTQCQCKMGYVLNTQKTQCISGGDFCAITLVNAYYNIEDNRCVCKEGYSYSNNTCATTPKQITPTPTVQSITTTHPTPKPDTPQKVEKRSVDFKVDDSKVKTINAIGLLDTPASFRKCPSTDCTIVRHYAEGSKVKISGEYSEGEWYRVEGTTDAAGKSTAITGWIHKTLFSQLKNESKDISPKIETLHETISTTTAKNNPAPQTENLQENPSWAKSFWKFIWRF